MLATYPNREAALAATTLDPGQMATVDETFDENGFTHQIIGLDARGLLITRRVSATPSSNAALSTLSDRVDAVEAVSLPIRQLYLFDTLANLNAVSRHAGNVYALVTDGDLELVSNGTDTWAASTVTDLIEQAANQQIWIMGNLTLAEAAAYAPPIGGVEILYGEIDEDTIL